jgi:hypothetical protein
MELPVKTRRDENENTTRSDILRALALRRKILLDRLEARHPYSLLELCDMST